MEYSRRLEYSPRNDASSCCLIRDRNASIDGWRRKSAAKYGEPSRRSRICSSLRLAISSPARAMAANAGRRNPGDPRHHPNQPSDEIGAGQDQEENKGFE
jgi:hypothetical protein